MCDTNGDAEADGDAEPSAAEFPFCSSLDQLELDVPVALSAASGNKVVQSAKDIETSGSRGAGFAPTKAAYELTFKKSSSASGFSYACAIHGTADKPMKGAVVVK
jgi:hypothetical protein